MPMSSPCALKRPPPVSPAGVAAVVSMRSAAPGFPFRTPATIPPIAEARISGTTSAARSV